MAAVFFGALPRLADLPQALRLAASVGPAWGTTLLGLTAAFLLATWFALARLVGARLPDAAIAHLMSTAVAHTVPAGGVVAYGVNLAVYRAAGISMAAVASGLLLVALLDNAIKLALPVLVVVVAPALGDAGRPPVAAAVVGGGALVAAVVVLGLLLRRPAAVAALARWLQSVAARVRPTLAGGDWGRTAADFQDRMRAVLGRHGAAAGAGLLAAHVLQLALLVSALRALGVPATAVGTVRVVVVYVAVRLLTAIPVTPGGLGVAELGYVAGLRAAAPDHAEAIAAAALIFRAATYLAPILLGAAAALWWRVRLRRPPGTVAHDHEQEHPLATVRIFVGTYTESLPHVHGTASGIGLLRFDPDTGRLHPTGEVAGVQNPSYVALAPSGRHLYAVNETSLFAGSPGGGVSAFAVDDDSLRPLGSVASGGADPAFVTVDAGGRFVVVANYSGGSVAVLPIRPDGSLGEATDVVRHSGSGVHPERQEAPHPHMAAVDPATGLIHVPDLGLDRVVAYELSDTGTLVERPALAVALQPGAGPRHVAFHPDGRHAFLVNELDSTLVLLRRGTEAYEPVQTLTTVPSGFSGRNQPAAVRVAPSGRFVYVSNRGHDSIAVFAFDSTALAPAGHVPAGGAEPRDFAFDPSGRWLLVAHQNAGTISVFAVDDATGALSVGDTVAVPTPVCLAVLA